MFGKTTAVILGAGASYCYGGGNSGIPVQQNLIGKLFAGHDTGSGEGFPSFVGPSGPAHSFRLAKYLRKRFGIPEDPQKRNAKLDFWLILQEGGFNLESLYNELERELTGDYRILLDDFAAIVRTAVSSPVGERGLESVCPHHRRLCEALEPGDYVIDFNWDSVMADTFLYYSYFWFPATGFGVSGVFPLLPPCQKSIPMTSLVHLLPIHGSVVLFELDDPQDAGQRGMLFLGPRQWSAMTGWMELNDIQLGSRGSTSSGGFPARPELQGQEERLMSHGHIYLQGKWFSPLFIPPSRKKPQYQHWFFQRLRRLIHSLLPGTTRFVVAGYSFPEADLAYLKEIFVPGVMRRDATVEIVNPENKDDSFQRRAKKVFPSIQSFSFEETDFRRFCAELKIEYPDRPEHRPRQSEAVGPTPSADG